jgi:hypothetical protein
MIKEKAFMKNLRSFVIGLGCAALLFAAGCSRDAGDVAFVKKTFRELIKGHYAARHVIAWDEFMAIDMNAGVSYKALPNEEERVKFQRNFVDAFRAGFAYQKADPRRFGNFRVIKRSSPDVTVVGADVKEAPYVLMFGVKHKGGRRLLTAIQILRVKDRAAFEAAEKEAQSGRVASQ